MRRIDRADSRTLPLLLLLAVLCNCSSLISNAPPESDIGIPYSGLKFHGDCWGYHAYLGIMGAPLGTVEAIIAFPLLVVDFCLTAIADSLLLPIDLSVESQKTDHKTPENVFGPLH